MTRACALFEQALALPVEERSAFLAQACAGDARLRAEVESLLEHDAQAAGADFLEPQPPARRTATTPAQATTDQSGGLHLEGYELLRELSRGGQGVVYQALQKSTKRKVAIKVLLEGPYASKAAQRRFEREVELIAQLKHPNVIAIFDSGITPEGRHYYLMDYVRGVPLHQYVRDRQLTLEQTLELFATVCEGVQYAHQKGIIHRDLKPTNILVEADGTPKIMDFGLAKLLAGPEQTLVSISQELVGTLPYMSPEQARGNPDEIDTRTDVYALGVVLYELLTGHYPYPVVGQIVEVLKHITETEPTPLSKRWTQHSGIAKRSSKKLRLGQCPIDNEVQTIVLRSLAKERERRYQSAGELARDVRHYLSGEPIEAKKDSGLYLLRKTIRRYRVPLAAALIFVIMLAGFGAAMSVLSARNAALADSESAAKRAAEAARESAEAAAGTLRRSMWTIYLNTLHWANSAFDAGDIAGAHTALAAAPAEYRGWEWGYFSAVSDTCSAVLQGHEGRVDSAVFSADGTRIVTASMDGTARVWDAATGVLIAELKRHTAGLSYAAFSPDGKRILTASGGSAIPCVWETATGTLVTELRGHKSSPASAIFSPDGAWIVTWAGSTARVWHAATGRPVAEVAGHTAPITVAVFSPDGARILTASVDQTVRLWDAHGAPLAVLRGHDAWVTSAAFSPDGTRVVTGSGDHTARVWDAATGAEVMVLGGHRQAVKSVTFSPDGTRIVTASSDATARVWDATTGAPAAELRGHTGEVTSAAFSPDGTRIVTASDDTTARLWDAGIGALLRTLQGHTERVTAAAFNCDGTRIVTAGDTTACVWDLTAGARVAPLMGHADSLNSAAFSQDGTRIVTASDDTTARIWDTTTGEPLAELRGHTGAVNSAAFSPDGTWIVTASDDTTARIWDTATGEPLLGNR